MDQQQNVGTTSQARPPTQADQNSPMPSTTPRARAVDERAATRYGKDRNRQTKFTISKRIWDEYHAKQGRKWEGRCRHTAWSTLKEDSRLTRCQFIAGIYDVTGRDHVYWHCIPVKQRPKSALPMDPKDCSSTVLEAIHDILRSGRWRGDARGRGDRAGGRGKTQSGTRSGSRPAPSSRNMPNLPPTPEATAQAASRVQETAAPAQSPPTVASQGAQIPSVQAPAQTQAPTPPTPSATTRVPHQHNTPLQPPPSGAQRTPATPVKAVAARNHRAQPYVPPVAPMLSTPISNHPSPGDVLGGNINTFNFAIHLEQPNYFSRGEGRARAMPVVSQSSTLVKRE